MKLPVLALIFGSILVAGCSGSKTESSTTTSGAPKPAEKVKTTDVVVGKGLDAQTGDMVWVMYKGTLKNGTEFDSNMKDDKDPLNFTLGAGDVVTGWDEGIPGMKVGGERKLEVPPSLGYGANGKGAVPPNAVMLFTVKLVGVLKPGQENVIDIEELKPGKGGRMAKPGDTVTIQYVGKLLNGKVFEDSHGKKPYSFTIDKSQSLPCIDKAVQGMTVGQIRKVTSPPSTAYAMKPTNIVPPNSMVTFEIELVAIK